jgi:hypothetical protein
MSKAPDITIEAWQAELARYHRRVASVPPGTGWLTLPELRARLRLGRCKAQAFLAAAVKSGAVEIYRGTRLTAVGYLQKAVWYRVKRQKP